jgi:DnaK suppressor protein
MTIALLTEQELLSQMDENYMDVAQTAFFRDRLLRKRVELVERIEAYRVGLKDAIRMPDEADFASNEEQRNLSLNMLALERSKLVEVGKALEAIEAGEYGYCLDSGYPIGLQRLLIKPETFYSVESMRAHELQQRHVARA